MIVECAIGLSACILVTLLVSSRNEVKGWFLIRWLMTALSFPYRLKQRKKNQHTCRAYRSIREQWDNGQCQGRIHQVDELEWPQDINSEPEAENDIHFFMTNAGGDWISLGLHRARKSAVLLNLCLHEQGLYQHPTHPLREVRAQDSGFQAADLNIQLLEPRRRWRIAYNGWLRKGLLNPSGGNENYDETAGEFVHVRFYFIWEAYTDPFDADLDLDPLARTLAYGLRAVDRLTLASCHTDQFGEMHGHVWVAGDKRHVRMRGAKIRKYVPDPVSMGLTRENLDDTTASVMHYITLETGVAVAVGLMHTKHMPENTSLCYGYVMMPIGGWTTVTHTNLNLVDFTDGGSMEYNFNFYTGGEKYRVHVRCQTSAAVLGAGLRTWTRPLTVTVNTWAGTGTLVVNNRENTDVHDRPISARASIPPPPPAVRQARILVFSDPWCRLTELVGGKGASLAQLTQAGDMVRVPPGFCLTVAAYQQHLADNPELDKLISELIQDPSSDLEKRCEAIGQAFLMTSIGEALRQDLITSLEQTFGADWEDRKRLAVRSSAVGEDGSDLSCAGQMDTYLGVKGQTQVLESVLKCWSSQYAFPAVQYRRQHGQPARTGMCVVLQEMVDSHVSGVMFTRDPISGDPGRVTINASYGLGEAVVSGVSEPDTVILSRTAPGDLTLLNTVLGSKRISMHMTAEGGMTSEESDGAADSCCISHQTALKLGHIGVQLERYYGDARDVEWAIHDDVIYILQARPITSFDTFTDEECMEEFDLPLASDRAWLTTGNIGEMSPGALTPLTVSAFPRACELLMTSLGPARTLRGVTYDQRAYKGSIVGSTANHLFINLWGVYQLSEHHVASSSRQGADVALVGHVVRDIREDHVVEYTGRSTWWRRLYNLYQQLKLRSAANKRTKAWEERLKTYSIEGDTASQLYQQIDLKFPDYIEVWMDAGVCTSKSGVAAHALVGVIAGDKYDWRPEHFSDVALILERCDNVYSADVPSAIRDLSESIRRSGHADHFLALDDHVAATWLAAPPDGRVAELFHRFMAMHGHRCIREAEFRETSWRTEPVKIISSIKMMLRARETTVKERPQRTPEELMAAMKTPLKFTQRLILKWLIPWGRRAVGEREWGKSVSICMVDKFKQAYWRLGQLMTEEGYLPDRDLVFFLTHHEIRLMLTSRPPSLITKALKRRRMLSRMSELSFPLLSPGHPVPDLPVTIQHSGEGDAVCLTGTPVSQGLIRGVARVVKTLPEAHHIQEGDILLVPYTDVGWTPYFPLISGLVTEIGSILSHGAVVAREYGLPCIVNCRGATDVFKSGDRILLDAGQGLLSKIPQEV